MSPAENLVTVLAVCAVAGVNAYTRFVTVLAAYSESDFVPRKAPTDETFGILQQNPKFWPTAHGTPAEQCLAFLSDFQGNALQHNTDPVHDAWITQRWSIPGSKWPDIGPNYESEARRGPGPNGEPGSQTWNYRRRVPLIDQIIRDRRLP